MEFIKLIENEKGYTYLSYSFNYRESCNNVYKSSKTVINGKNSNITANTYFWTPKRNSQGRRNAENYRNGEVQQFFLSEGFTEVEGLNLPLKFKNQPACLKKGEELWIESQGGVFLKYRKHMITTLDLLKKLLTRSLKKLAKL